MGFFKRRRVRKFAEKAVEQQNTIFVFGSNIFAEAFNLFNKQNVWQVFNNWYDNDTFGDTQTYFHGRVIQLAVRLKF